MKILLLILFFVLPQAAINEALFLFEKGNEFYEDGKFDQAIEQYEKALSKGYGSGQLYYNMGNVYFKRGEIGKSILYYERARKLLPRDKDVEFNLNIANLYVVDKIAVPEQFILFKVLRDFKNYFSISILSWATLILYLIVMLFFSLRILVRKHAVRRLASIVLVPGLIVLIVFASTFALRLHEQASVVEGVVMNKKIQVLSSPSKDATGLFSLHEGVKVRIDDSSGEWFKIVLADGKIGWVDKSVIEII